MSHVSWSVCICLCVGDTGEMCKDDWTDRDAVWKMIHVRLRNHVFHGVQVPHGKGHFWGGACAGALHRAYAWMHCARRGRMCLSSARSGRMYSPPRGYEKTAMRTLAKLLWTLVTQSYRAWTTAAIIKRLYAIANVDCVRDVTVGWLVS